jgi:Tfp pilus assembly protein PilF
MSMTLNLVDRILHRACQLQDIGRSQAALRLLTKLAGWRDLPQDVVEEAHVHLAEIYLEHGEPKRARRHLAVVIAQQPDCAHYHYLMAIAVEDDPNCSAQRAGVHYRRCLALDPEHAESVCDYGLHALRYGRPRAGLKALRRAAELAPDDPDMLGRVAGGLRQANRAEEARSLLRAALFRNPHDRRFRDLLGKHQFELLHARQNEARPSSTAPARAAVILKMPRRTKRLQRVGAKTIRTDAACELRGPTILPFHIRRKQEA